MSGTEHPPTKEKAGRLARFANVFLPVTEARSAARNARSMGVSIVAAVGAVSGRVKAVLRREEAPQATVIDPGLMRDGARQARALRFARIRWVVGLVAMVAGVYQLGGALFTPAGFVAVVNFILSAVLLGVFGVWQAMVAARDAAALQGNETVSNLEILKTPTLWVPW